MSRRESCTRIGNVREMLYQYIYHGVWREDSREGISAATQSFSPHNLHWANYNKDKSAMANLKCFTSSCSNSPKFGFYSSQLDCGPSDLAVIVRWGRPSVCWRLFILRDRHSLLHVRQSSSPGVATLNYHPATQRSTELRPAQRSVFID